MVAALGLSGLKFSPFVFHGQEVGGLEKGGGGVESINCCIIEEGGNEFNCAPFPLEQAFQGSLSPQHSTYSMDGAFSK
jgi:hypothetical protein